MAKIGLAIVVAALLWPGLCAADSAAWDAYMRDGTSAFERGDYSTASRLFELAIKGAESFGAQDLSLARALTNLANRYWALGRYADAEPLYKSSLAICERALGPEHPDVAASVTDLAMLYHIEGRYADAEPLYKRSLAIREKALGPEHPDVADSLYALV